MAGQGTPRGFHLISVASWPQRKHLAPDRTHFDSSAKSLVRKGAMANNVAGRALAPIYQML